MTEKLTIRDFANHFGLKWINGDQQALLRPVTEHVVSRPGLELTGYFKYPRANRIIFLGNKEISYINSCTNRKKLLEAFDFITNEECPGIVICQNHECPEDLLDICVKKNFPLFGTMRNTNELTYESVVYLGEKLAPNTSIHASLVEIFSEGVIILGESGIGKSETTLELIKKGHQIVADDRVEISLFKGELIGRAPELLVGMMEVRGIGIIDVPRMFGINSLLDRTTISFAIKLVHFRPEEPMERLGIETQYYEILGKKIPLLTLPVSGARSMAEIIEVAITNLKLKKFGYDSGYVFENRLKELMDRKKSQ